MQFDTPSQYKAMVTGGADWVGVLVDLFLYSSIGSLLLMANHQGSRKRLLAVGKRLSLIE
jgi:hypothetical protein